MDFTAVEQNLKARGFAVSTFADAASAADYLNAQIDGSSAAFGGSVTLEQLSLFMTGSARIMPFTATGTRRRG